MFKRLQVSNLQIYAYAKLMPLVPKAHADHELLPRTAAIYTQGVKNQLQHMVRSSPSLPGGSRGQRQSGPLQVYKSHSFAEE